MLKNVRDAEVVAEHTLPADAGCRDEIIRASRSGVSFPSGAVEAQLQRVEARLVGLAGGDPVLERDVRRYLRESCARFATARVRQFVPILVEREVRARLRARDLPRAENRTA
jgi:hypothetical protein